MGLWSIFKSSCVDIVDSTFIPPKSVGRFVICYVACAAVSTCSAAAASASCCAASVATVAAGTAAAAAATVATAVAAAAAMLWQAS